MKQVNIFIILLSLLSLTEAAIADVSVSATIAALMTTPEAYRGKSVVVRGQIDNCASLTCNLCPEEMTDSTFDRDKCLGMEFHGFDKSESRAGNLTAETMEKIFRFATVTLTARFDPTCLTHKDASHPENTVVCTDRASSLFDVVVQEVHSRKNADTGIVSFYDFGKLSAPTDDDSRAMLAILSDLDPRDQRPLKFFITPGDLGKGTGVDAIGIGCYCLDKSCEGKWPQRWVLGFDNFGNDFYCYSLHKKHGVWSLLPDVL